MPVSPEDEAIIRDVAGFSDEIYDHFAKISPVFKKTMDVAKLWVAEQDKRKIVCKEM
jgi:hypothetical protein